MRRVLIAAALAVVAGTTTSAVAVPRLPERSPDHLVTTVTLSVSPTSPATTSGKAFGPDAPLAKISGRGGYMLADAGLYCGISVQQPVGWKLDAGHGDVLFGDIVSGGGGADGTVTFRLKASGGTGRYAGWDGWGTYQAVVDSGGCSNAFTGLWKVNRH